MRSNINEKGRWRVIVRVAVTLNDRDNVSEASSCKRSPSKVVIDFTTIEMRPRLPVSGVWSPTDVEYRPDEETKGTPRVLASLEPVQLSKFDHED